MKTIKQFILYFVLLVPFYSWTQIAVNTSGASPDASAGLDVSFTNRGVLIPRVALTSATDNSTIPSPATSLLVYNLGTGGLSPAGYYYWNGSQWVMLGLANHSHANLTFDNSGTGAASGAVYNTSSPLTISYNTIGAASSSHAHATLSNGTGISAFSYNGSSAATVSLTNTGVTAGTYGNTGANVPNITVDAQGRLTAASNRALTASDIGAAPTSHTHANLSPGTGLTGSTYNGGIAVSDWSVAYGNISGLANANNNGTANTAARADHQHKRDIRVANSGTDVGTRNRLNLIQGANVTLTVADDAANDEIDVTIAATSSGISMGCATDNYVLKRQNATTASCSQIFDNGTSV
ncbi:MAG: hypothetical protein N2449_03890, partial [Bacteroidales bacterium]|nr:hypothetical protein [Bacteroidales bacterium]